MNPKNLFFPIGKELVYSNYIIVHVSKIKEKCNMPHTANYIRINRLLCG